MDPERLQELLNLLDQARQEGATVEDLNADLAANGDLPFNTVAEVRQAAEARPVDAPTGQVVGDLLRKLSMGVTLGGSDEIAGGLAAIGAALPGGRSPGEAFRETQQNVEERQQASQERLGGVLGTGAEIAGGLLPVVRGIQGVKAGVGLLGKGARAAGKAVRNPRAAGRAAKEAVREVPRVLPQAGRGAVEGGLLGTGIVGAESFLRSPGSIEERAAAAVDNAPLGLLGVPLGAAARGVSASRNVLRAPREGGEVLAQSARRRSGLTGEASRVEADIAQQRAATRESLIRPIEAQGRDIPVEITETVLGNSVLRETAETFTPNVVRTADEAASGARASSTPLTAEEALVIRSKVSERASALKRGQALGSTDPLDVQRARSALRELDDQLEEAFEEFPEFLTQWRLQQRRSDALLAGRQVFGRSADDVRALWEGRPPANKGLRREFPNGLPDDGPVREAFREGLMTELVKKLESGEKGVAGFISDAQTSSQLRGKLRIAFGGDENLNRFMTAVTRESEVLTRKELVDQVIKFGGFTILGSSLGGGAATLLLGGD